MFFFFLIIVFLLFFSGDLGLLLLLAFLLLALLAILNELDGGLTRLADDEIWVLKEVLNALPVVQIHA